MQLTNYTDQLLPASARPASQLIMIIHVPQVPTFVLRLMDRINYRKQDKKEGRNQLVDKFFHYKPYEQILLSK